MKRQGKVHFYYSTDLYYQLEIRINYNPEERIHSPLPNSKYFLVISNCKKCHKAYPKETFIPSPPFFLYYKTYC